MHYLFFKGLSNDSFAFSYLYNLVNKNWAPAIFQVLGWTMEIHERCPTCIRRPDSLGRKTNDHKTVCQILSTRFYQDTKVGQLTQFRGEKGPHVGDA